MAEPLPNNDDTVKKEFVYDGTAGAPKTYKWKVGKSLATALTGFVAGVLAATIMLYPWLKFLGDLCPSRPQNTVTTGNLGTYNEAPPLEEAPPVAQPAP